MLSLQQRSTHITGILPPNNAKDYEHRPITLITPFNQPYDNFPKDTFEYHPLVHTLSLAESEISVAAVYNPTEDGSGFLGFRRRSSAASGSSTSSSGTLKERALTTLGFGGSKTEGSAGRVDGDRRGSLTEKAGRVLTGAAKTAALAVAAGVTTVSRHRRNVSASSTGSKGSSSRSSVGGSVDAGAELNADTASIRSGIRKHRGYDYEAAAAEGWSFPQMLAEEEARRGLLADVDEDVL